MLKKYVKKYSGKIKGKVMEINVVEYNELLKEEFPKYNFEIVKSGSYKNGQGEVYTIGIQPTEFEDEEFPSFSMIVGYFEFTEEQQKENFKRVAELTINARMKHLEELQKEADKKAS